MRLPRPFYRLPVRFDAGRLAAELAELPASAWVPHPNAIPGNSSMRLISVDGGANDDVTGRMLPTPELQASPYIRQVLASFGVVWSRSRLMRLAPGASVPLHADINYHWFSRVRVHIPVHTHPDVAFWCGDERVHMAAGEAWVFDNWRLHRVENPTSVERVHLVADTSGTAPFWRFVFQGDVPAARWRQHRFNPADEAPVMTEINVAAEIMPAAEVELLLGDLGAELAALDGGEEARGHHARYRMLLEDFCHDWRQLWVLHGAGGEGRADFARAREALREGSRQLGARLVTRTNGVAAHQVLEARVLRHLLQEPQPTGARETTAAKPVAAATARASPALAAPVFIVAAPRSGSTLLFETLARCRGFSTLGGEAHALIERHPELRPGKGAVESNRLEARHATDTLAAEIIGEILDSRMDADGSAVPEASPLRLLEKTPKNALRIPFIEQLFPDARYIFLWREPRASLASLIEAWGSGQWQTYPQLEGFDRPWSLLLPPGWTAMRGRTVAQIAAFQWEAANRIALDDLAALSPQRWCRVDYDELVADPAATTRRLCAFAEVDFDEALQAHLAQPLPLSRFTQTPPAPGKWRRHAAEIEPLIPGLDGLWRRLQANAGAVEKRYA